MFSVACLCCYCCLVPSRRGGGAARTHCLSRDRAPVERVDQWGGGIAAAEARPSARVGGLVPARASLLGGGAPEPRGQPGNPRRNERCLRRFSSGFRFDANARLSLARISLSSPLSSSPRPAARSESTREATDLGGHGFRRNRGRDTRARRFEWKRTRGGEVLTCSATRLSCPLSLSLYRLGRIILDIIIYYFAACGRNTFFERIFFEEYIVVVNYRAMRKRGEREERFQGWDGFDDRLSPSPSNTALWRRAPVRTAV